MIWTERLNTRLGRLDAGGAALEVLHWAHSDALLDNVSHRHAYFEVCLVGAHGAGIYTLENRAQPIASGDVFFARPGFVHRIQNSAQPRMELFWVSFAIAPHGSTPMTEGARLAQSFGASSMAVARDDGSVKALWSTLRSVASERPNAASALLIEQLQSALLVALMRAGAGAEVETAVSASIEKDAQLHNLARLAVRYIHDNLDRRLPVAEIAAHVHVSPRHLSRLLMEFTGASPASYIEHARMDRARALLRDTQLPTKAVADKVGYGDVQHFTRVFTRHHRIAPAAFRKDGSTYAVKIPWPGALV